MALIGQPEDSDAVRKLRAEGLASTEVDQIASDKERTYLSNRSAGYEMMFRAGVVDTVFLYLVPDEGFRSFQGPLPGRLSRDATRADVRRRFGTPEKSHEAQEVIVLRRQGAWDRFAVGAVCVHFEYTEPDEHIRRVTLMFASTAP